MLEVVNVDEPMQLVLDRFWRRAEPRGALLQDDNCVADELPYSSPGSPAVTHGGCGQTRVAWAYEGEDGEMSAVTVCAIGDCAYAMPRFL